MSRVALIGENSIEYVDKLLEIWNSGNCAVLIDWRIPFPTIAKMLNEANVDKCFIDECLINEKFFTFIKNVDIYTFKKLNALPSFLPDSIYAKFKPNYSYNDAVIIYSSGTTGKSKGIILSHYSINTNADAIIDYMKLEKNDCMYIAKTFSHSSTLTGEILVALKTRTKIVIAPVIVPPRYIVKNINRFKVTIVCFNPTLLSLFVDNFKIKCSDDISLKTIYVSGSIMSDVIYNKAHDVCPFISIFNVYGLSETGPRVTAQREGCCSSNSVGKPIKGVEIKLVKENGNLAVNSEKGVIYVKTPSKFSGYIKKQDKCILSFDNWINTGDVGYIDLNGELHILGRNDEVIILDSHKIYPNDVEKIILEFPSIKECVVMKINYNGNDIMACLYSGEYIEEYKIKNFLLDKLPSYETPRRFIHCLSIPQTNNGKISKVKVLELLQKELTKENMNDIRKNKK